jgi:hypothetical protein
MASLLTADRDREPRVLEDVAAESAAVLGRFPRACAGLLLRGALYRRALSQKPLLSPLSNARYQARLARHARRVPKLSDADRAVVAEIRGIGAAVRTVELPTEVLACADRIVDQLRIKETGHSCVRVGGSELGDDPALFLWGLSPRLLDIAEGYIGLPVRYLGLDVKRELVAPDIGGPRSWHLDDEDRRMLKVIVYLSDVDAGSGPFGYVEMSNTEKVRELIRRDEDRIPDEAMQTVVPREDWKHVAGPRLTGIYADTVQVFHRVFPPKSAERYSVTFAYSSRRPYFTYSRLMLPPRPVLRRLRNQLTHRQWEALCVSRG